MDDEKKMTLGVEEEKQFHSRFPFSRFSHPVLRHRSLCLSLSSLFIFSSDSRRSVHHAYDPTRARTRTRNASWPWSPRSRDDCNLHKLSFHFDDDVTETQPTEKRGVVNDREDRILCASYPEIVARYSIENLLQEGRSHSAFYLHHQPDYLRDICIYVKSRNEIKM